MDQWNAPAERIRNLWEIFFKKKSTSQLILIAQHSLAKACLRQGFISKQCSYRWIFPEVTTSFDARSIICDWKTKYSFLIIIIIIIIAHKRKSSSIRFFYRFDTTIILFAAKSSDKAFFSTKKLGITSQATGRKAIEKLFPKMHFTMNARFQS